MNILVIDPGSTESAYVLWDGATVLEKGFLLNQELACLLGDNQAFRTALNYGRDDPAITAAACRRESPSSIPAFRSGDSQNAGTDRTRT